MHTNHPEPADNADRSDTADTVRENEIVIAPEQSPEAWLSFIGLINTPWLERSTCPRQGDHTGPICELVLDQQWVPALDGLAEYEFIEVLYWLHHSRRDLVTQSPRADGRTFGTFALRSPVRPNPIGTSIVKLERIDGNRLYVRGLDCLNGTPLLDIKPDRSLFTPKAAPKTPRPD